MLGENGIRSDKFGKFLTAVKHTLGNLGKGNVNTWSASVKGAELKIIVRGAHHIWRYSSQDVNLDMIH